MKKPINQPKPVRIEIIKGKAKIIKDRLVIVKPAYYN
jgi:hypothetical protein